MCPSASLTLLLRIDAQHRCHFFDYVVDSNGVLDASNSILTAGTSFVKPDRRCFLCGCKDGLKIPCAECGKGPKKPYYHPTCARQAGFQVEMLYNGGDGTLLVMLFLA